MPTDLASETLADSMPRSALRHRPIAQTEPNKQVQTPRASRGRQKPALYTTNDQSIPVPSSGRTPKVSRTWLIYLALGMLCAFLLLWIGQILFNWITTLSDDLHYGRPRTTHVDHFVGHETGNTPSHFVAMNLNGQIYVVEMSGGNPNTTHVLVGPHLVGSGSDLAVVSLSFPGDPQHPDLLISAAGVQVRFQNTSNGYVPET
jgi:hypothetical protein